MATVDGTLPGSDAVASMLPASARVLLIYDGYCGICTRIARWVQRRSAGRVAVLPNQTRGMLARTGLSRAEVDREVWAIDRAGRRGGGAAAVNRALAEMGWWRHPARLYATPGIRQAEEAIYAWVARNRGRLARWGITPGCAAAGADCEPEDA